MVKSAQKRVLKGLFYVHTMIQLLENESCNQIEMGESCLYIFTVLNTINHFMGLSSGFHAR